MPGWNRFSIDKLMEAMGVDEERLVRPKEPYCGRVGEGGRAERWEENQEKSESLTP